MELYSQSYEVRPSCCLGSRSCIFIAIAPKATVTLKAASHALFVNVDSDMSMCRSCKTACSMYVVSKLLLRQIQKLPTIVPIGRLGTFGSCKVLPTAILLTPGQHKS